MIYHGTKRRYLEYWMLDEQRVIGKMVTGYHNQGNVFGQMDVVGIAT